MKTRTYPFYFASGALALYLLFFVLPSLMGFYYAFTDWNSYSTEVNFVGLENFKLIFSSGSGQNYLLFIQKHGHLHRGHDRVENGHCPGAGVCS